MERRGTLKIVEISESEYFSDKEVLKDIVSNWMTNGVHSSFSGINPLMKNKISKQVDLIFSEKSRKTKSYRLISEANGSAIYSKQNDSVLAWSNISIKATKGEVHGIDLVHVSNDKKIVHIIEVKYTDEYVSQNFTNARKQLLSRVNKSKLEQLEKAISDILDKKMLSTDHEIVKYLTGETEKIENVLLVPFVISKTKKSVNIFEEFYQYYVIIK